MDKIIKIWRVEDEAGQGCYRDFGIKFLDRMMNRHDSNFTKYPIPEVDKGINRAIRPGEICGFINLEQALNWFSKYELKKLLCYGLELKEIEVKKITAIGEKQVLAIR